MSTDGPDPLIHLAAALKSLAPRASGVDRDQLMFQAGQASAHPGQPVSLHSSIAIMCVAVCTTLTTYFAWQWNLQPSQAPVVVQQQQPARPSNSAEWPSIAIVESAPPELLILRERALRGSFDDQPRQQSNSSDETSSEPSLLKWRSQMLDPASS